MEEGPIKTERWTTALRPETAIGRSPIGPRMKVENARRVNLVTRWDTYRELFKDGELGHYTGYF